MPGGVSTLIIQIDTLVFEIGTAINNAHMYYYKINSLLIGRR